MRRHSFLFTIVLFISFKNHTFSESGPGSIQLDEYNFDKVTNKFEASLIKFDILFPFGNKHEGFLAFAKDSINEKDLLVAEIRVQDYADEGNLALARKYGATKANLPLVKLFVKGKEPITFDEDAEGFTSDKLRRFVSKNSGLFLSLPGCVKEFDKLAIHFMKGKKDVRKKVLKKTKELLKIKDKLPGKVYITIMEKVLEKGDHLIESEVERVKKLLSGKVSDENKKQFVTRINILQTFQSFDELAEVARDDL